MATAKKILKPDTKGRITLGKLAENISSFEVIVENGRIILEPLIEISARELWLYKNPEAFASLERGLEQANRGEAEYLGDFSQYLEDADD
jgi:hypothetical protein